MTCDECVMDWIGLAVSALTPLVLFFLGFRAHAYVDKLARRRKFSEVETAWRLEVFRGLLDSLNDLHCYFMYEGSWSLMTPDDATRAKRSADRLVHMNGFLWSPEFMAAYRRFGAVAFRERRGPGETFLIRANVARHRENKNWRETWADRFVSEDERVRRVDFEAAYTEMIGLAVQDLGVVSRVE